MRGYRIGLAAAVILTLFGVAAMRAQDSQDKSSSSSQDKPSTNTPDKPSSDTLPWYNPKRYNPKKLVKGEGNSANDQLASNGHLEDKLSKQLRIQGILGQDQELQAACSNFRELATCIAVLRLSKSLPVEFTCLKWNVTGVKPKGVADSCAGPAGGKAMPLDRSIDLLKPNADDRKEAQNALRKAHDDIRDASS